MLFTSITTTLCTKASRERVPTGTPTPDGFHSIARIEDPGIIVGWDPRVGCVSSSAPREYVGVASNVNTERIFDLSCVPGGRELVGHIHDLVVGWVRRMVVIDIPRGRGEGGRRGMKAQPRVPFIIPSIPVFGCSHISYPSDITAGCIYTWQIDFRHAPGDLNHFCPSQPVTIMKKAKTAAIGSK
jgi:hypothetical protein